MQRSRIAAAIVLAFAMVAGSTEARTETVGAGIGPRSLSIGEALRAASVGSLAITLNPAGLAMSRSYVIEGTYGYRPQDSANLISASVCDSMTTRVAGCFFYDYAGSSVDGGGDRSAHEGGITLAMPLSDRIFLGWTSRYVHYEDTSDTTRSRNGAFLSDAGLIVRATDMFAIGVAGRNLVGGDDADYPLSIGGGIAVTPSPQLTLAADARWNVHQKGGRFGGGGEYFFASSDGQQGYPVRVGYVYDAADGASYITGGLGLVTPKLGIDIGMRGQVDGGHELLMQIGLRLFVPNP